MNFADAQVHVPSPYVKASSPQEATRILDALQSPEAASPSARAAAAAVEYGPCKLYPTRIYMRTSGGLGAKPETRCRDASNQPIPVTSIHHETDLRSWWIAWWWLADTYTAGNNGQSKLEQKNVQWSCTSSDETTWAGTTLGTIEYGGNTFYARVYQDAVDWPCGD